MRQMERLRYQNKLKRTWREEERDEGQPRAGLTGCGLVCRGPDESEERRLVFASLRSAARPLSHSPARPAPNSASNPAWPPTPTDSPRR